MECSFPAEEAGGSIRTMRSERKAPAGSTHQLRNICARVAPRTAHSPDLGIAPLRWTVDGFRDQFRGNWLPQRAPATGASFLAVANSLPTRLARTGHHWSS